MAENSKIEWTDHTFNPWVGCTKVSPACDHCYAEGWAKRTGQDQLWAGERRRTSTANWKEPLRWNRKAEVTGVRAKVFCASLADVFDNQVPDEWRVDLWRLIEATPNLDWLLLTKRPQNAGRMMMEARRALLGADVDDRHVAWPWHNIWLGTTVENQKEADRRIPNLLNTPAAKRFLSCEPLLGPVNLRRLDIDGEGEINCLHPATEREIWDDAWAPDATGMSLEEAIESWEDEGGTYPPSDARKPGIDWVICGGESGPSARPMHPDWARQLRDQCQDAGVPFFMKQWGEWQPFGPVFESDGMLMSLEGVDEARLRMLAPDGGIWPDNSVPPQGSWMMHVIGKKAAGAMLDGREWREMPE